MKKIGIIGGVFMLLLSISAQAEVNKNIKDYEIEISHCLNTFTSEEHKCSEYGSMKCYDFLMDLHKKTQQCNKKVGVEILQQFYSLSQQDAKAKIDNFSQFIYDEYLFIYNNTIYCTKNNCGISPYLNSEYITTEELSNYIFKMINSVSARN